MIRSLLLFLIFFGYAGVGLFVPFIAALGYVWVDLMRPQQLAYSILPSVPVSLILFCVMVLSYVVFDRRNPPRITGLMVLLVVFALWVSATLLWAQHPSDAFAKWDWAIKVLIFAVFVPFIIRSRIQIEAFMLTYLFAVSGVAITYGIKTAVTGGGFYGHNYGFNFGNSGLGESSTMSIACAMLIPTIFYMAKHSLILRGLPWLKYMAIGLAVLFMLAIIGSHARTGLVAIGAVSGVYFLLSRRKFLFAFAASFVLLISIPFISNSWSDRMETIANFEQDTSASTRLSVWMWTLDYVAQRPLGGGFDSYRDNAIEVTVKRVDQDGNEWFETVTDRDRAFHSNYFEVLGEHGWPGLFIYLMILLVTMRGHWKLHRAGKRGEVPVWVGDLGTAMFVGVVGFAVGGLFVGIAFQPIFYHFASILICLQQYVRYLNIGQSTPSPAWGGEALPQRSYGWKDR